MSGLGPVILMVLAAANPAAGALSVAWRPSNRDRWQSRVLMAVAAAAGVLWLLAALADPILDALSVSVGTWRLATSVPFAVAGLRWMVLPARPVHDEPRAGVQVALIALTVLLTPQMVTVVLATAAHDGTLRTMAGVVPAALLVAGLLRARAVPTPLLATAARLLGGLAVVLAIALGVDGTQTI
ncbi:hypothetical protein [Candidatus Poriferisocius sp.]|uniref:hypothetical protein n=1 Tax=Candidatus Poriferisocius sp. TaxID=3101276 RepID=UPI003B012931